MRPTCIISFAYSLYISTLTSPLKECLHRVIWAGVYSSIQIPVAKLTQKVNHHMASLGTCVLDREPIDVLGIGSTLRVDVCRSPRWGEFGRGRQQAESQEILQSRLGIKRTRSTSNWRPYKKPGMRMCGSAGGSLVFVDFVRFPHKS